jgi:outer membrane protein assembly factor BamB
MRQLLSSVSATPLVTGGYVYVPDWGGGLATHDSSYLLGLNPETSDLLWKVTLDKHPATILAQSPVVYDGVICGRPLGKRFYFGGERLAAFGHMSGLLARTGVRWP